MPNYDVSVSHEAKRLGVNRTTLVDAIRAGRCKGEERDGRWYTSTDAAAKWYADHYRHKGVLYSQTAGKIWSAADVAALRDMLGSGSSLMEIAAALKRSVGSVKVKISKLRASDVVAIPPAAEVRAFHQKKQLIEEAKAILSAERSVQLPNSCPEHRRQEREGRVRLHLHPAVVPVLGEAARKAGLTLAVFVTRAGLAAALDSSILERGRKEAEKIGR